VALNFPNSPTVGQVYTDTNSGFSYEWDGTVWKSYSAASSGQIKILDDVSSYFNGIGQTFALTSNGSAITPPSSASLIINLGGVVQDPSDDYSVSESNIVFSTPPSGGLSFSGISLGAAIPVSTIPDGTTTSGSFGVVGVLTASSLSVSGITTLGSSTGVGTVTVGSGLTALLVEGDARVTGILTIGTASITLDGSTNTINVGTGVTISGAGEIQASSLSIGGQSVSTLGVGIATESGTVGVGATVLDFRGAGISTVTVADGVATINVTGGGGGGASVSISTIAPTSPSDGDLWFDNSDGNTYIWYNDQSVWVVSQTYGY